MDKERVGDKITVKRKKGKGMKIVTHTNSIDADHNPMKKGSTKNMNNLLNGHQ